MLQFWKFTMLFYLIVVEWMLPIIKKISDRVPSRMLFLGLHISFDLFWCTLLRSNNEFFSWNNMKPNAYGKVGAVWNFVTSQYWVLIYFTVFYLFTCFLQALDHVLEPHPRDLHTRSSIFYFVSILCFISSVHVACTDKMKRKIEI